MKGKLRSNYNSTMHEHCKQYMFVPSTDLLQTVFSKTMYVVGFISSVVNHYLLETPIQ